MGGMSLRTCQSLCRGPGQALSKEIQSPDLVVRSQLIHQRNELERSHTKSMHQQHSGAGAPLLYVVYLAAKPPVEPLTVRLDKGSQSFTQPCHFFF